MNIKNGKIDIAKPVKILPDGFHTVTPYLIAKGAAELMNFIADAFDGHVISIMNGDNDNVIHATMQIGNSKIMIADEMEGMPAQNAMLYIYVDEVDSIYQQALDAGGVSIREPEDEFYGDRSAGIKDDWGNQWWVATHLEDVSDKELKVRMENSRKQTAN